MIDDIKAHIETKGAAAGFNVKKIITTSDSAFDSDKDIRPTALIYGIKIENLQNANHLGDVVNITARVLCMIVEKTQQEAVLKILNIHEQLHDSHVDFSDSRFTMEDVFKVAGPPIMLAINKKEATYAIEYDATVTVRL